MLIFLAILVMVVYVVQSYSGKHALKDVDYDYTFSKRLIEPEEPFELISTIINKSRRFIPFILLQENLPKGVRAVHEKAGLKEDALGNVRYNSTIYMTARSKLERRLEIIFPSRGCYLFQGGRLHGGDFLGLQENRESFSIFREVVVYPRGVNVDQLEQMLGGFLGEVSVRRFIMEDPILTIGIREYTGSEPLNLISWKHSARNNELMVKQLDYTVETVITIVLDINGSGRDNPQHIEACFSLARSICQLFKEKNVFFDFVSNARIKTSKNQPQQLYRNLGNAQVHDILERLGRSTHHAFESFDQTVENVRLKREKSSGVIVITPQKDLAKQEAVQVLEAAGSAVIFMYGEDVDDFS